MVSFGIDLGASTLHVVGIRGSERDPAEIAITRTFDAADRDSVVALLDGADEIAIDAPAQLSTAPHRGSDSISPKFRTARCGEIALGEQSRIWVPWVTPHDAGKVAGWMQVGFDLWAALRAAGHEPVEVYPAGVFRVLAGETPPRKTTRAGVQARIELLARCVALPPGIEMWSHDGIDALGAAVTALQKARGVARSFRHDGPSCDGSAIWLPEAPQPG